MQWDAIEIFTKTIATYEMLIKYNTDKDNLSFLYIISVQKRFKNYRGLAYFKGGYRLRMDELGDLL